jgi:hypothetical protein
MVVEWVAVPLLERAVNALFDAGQALLERRRADSAELESPTPLALAAADRDRMLHQRVSELVIEARAVEVEALIEQIEIHQANLNRASKQAAMWGEALVPPIIANTVDSEVEKLRTASERLRSLLDQLAEGS